MKSASSGLAISVHAGHGKEMGLLLEKRPGTALHYRPHVVDATKRCLGALHEINQTLSPDLEPHLPPRLSFHILGHHAVPGSLHQLEFGPARQTQCMVIQSLVVSWLKRIETADMIV